MNTTQASALDRMLAAKASSSQIAREIIAQARAGLEPFCDIPDGYRHCRLDHTACNLDDLSENQVRSLIENPPGAIINPRRVHLEAIDFFRMILEGNPLACENGATLRPKLGAYLVGPPGVGKTHIMAAFGLCIKQRLDKELARMERTIAGLVERIYARTLDQQAEWSRHPIEEDNRWILTVPGFPPAMKEGHGGTLLQRAVRAGVSARKLLMPEEYFAAAVGDLQRRVRDCACQPTDLLYLGFESLFEESQRSKERRASLFTALEQARFVFIDDIHPKGDPERIRVIQQLIERRYELDRPGTFLTTNLTSEELGAGDKMVGRRLLSRCSENFIKFDFSECVDWRMEVKSRRISLVERAVRERLSRGSNLPDGIRQPATGLPKDAHPCPG